MTDLESKIARLPGWAREHIKMLTERPASLAEETARGRKRIDYLEKLNTKLKEQNEAMLHMFECASKGENEVAKAVMKIAEEYLMCDGE